MQMWDYTIDGIREIVSAHPDVQFAIEYKPKEPRVRMTLANAPKTLLAIQEVGLRQPRHRHGLRALAHGG